MSARLDAALVGCAALGSEAAAIHAGERLAEAIARELTPIRSFARLPIAPMWIEAWAACQPLALRGLVRLVRTATRIDVGSRRVLVDPCVPDAWLRTPLGERVRSLHPWSTSETVTRALPELVGALENYTDVVFTTASFQGLCDLVGTRRDASCVVALGARFPNARFYLGARAFDPLAEELAASRVRGGLDRIDRDRLALVEGPMRLGDELVLVPTPGSSPEHLTVAFATRGQDRRVRVGVVTSNVVTREALAPYESRWPGLREHARLRDASVALRGDAGDPPTLRRMLRFEQALADRDPDDPRFHLVFPSQELAG